MRSQDGETAQKASRVIVRACRVKAVGSVTCITRVGRDLWWASGCTTGRPATATTTSSHQRPPPTIIPRTIDPREESRGRERRAAPSPAGHCGPPNCHLDGAHGRTTSCQLARQIWTCARGAPFPLPHPNPFAPPLRPHGVCSLRSRMVHQPALCLSICWCPSASRTQPMPS
jgi:hypothetical protein